MLVAIFVTCTYHIAKHPNPLKDLFPLEMENFGGGGEEGTGLVVILEIKRNQVVIGVERGKRLVLIDAILLLLLVYGTDTSYATVFMNKTIQHSFFL